jgi:hypothetical protein
MGSVVLLSEALLHSAERVHMDVHPGLARSRTAQRNVPRRVCGEKRGKTTLFPCFTGSRGREPDHPFHTSCDQLRSLLRVCADPQ